MALVMGPIHGDAMIYDRGRNKERKLSNASYYTYYLC